MLHISYLSDRTGKKPTFSLSDGALAHCEHAFAVLEIKTGLHIDPYKDLRIYPDHQTILIDALSNELSGCVQAFVQYLTEARQAGEILKTDGD